MARRSYGRLPPLPKPYDFVDISPLERDDRRHPAGHDRYYPDTLSGRLTGQLTALSPVHVASGLLEMTGRRDVPLVKAHVRSAGRPVIPGSSFKGAIRSIVEAISRSCVRVTRVRRNQLPRDADGCRNPRRLCVACRMFGSLGFQGNVRFSAAVLRAGFEPGVVSIPAL